LFIGHHELHSQVAHIGLIEPDYLRKNSSD
jgi:hypothetical protein